MLGATMWWIVSALFKAARPHSCAQQQQSLILAVSKQGYKKHAVAVTSHKNY